MSERIKQKLKKIILIMLLIITVFTTVLPGNVVFAKDTEGGTLFKPVFQFLCGIADLGIKFLQDYFMGYGDIKPEEVNLGGTTINSKFKIIYSPAVIFSNKVPALDVNFFKPGKSYTANFEKQTTKRVDNTAFKSYGVPLNDVQEKKKNFLSKYGYNDSSIQNTDYNSLPETIKKETSSFWITNSTTTCERWTYNGITYYYVQCDTNSFEYLVKDLIGPGYHQPTTEAEKQMATQMPVFTYSMEVYESKTSGDKGKTRQSSASILQGVVATWYKALRTVSLVGLLSVLVYIGIRIIISSTGEEKAKYKKMINNWLAAMCLLFVLHYIMAGILWITEELTNVFSVNVINAEGVDTFMSGIRGEVGDTNDFITTFGSAIIYIALVVLTFIFTFQYLKRLLYMAFFTMIAPLIALTYPIDKIKDGQAQAFSTWIKEYTFNALIQVIHIILYFMLIHSAESLVEENPLYAVVAIGFMVPAEKFFRKLFGFDKASTVGQLGAAAGGALVMNAINKMGQKAGKEAAAKESKPPKFFGSSPSDKVLGSGGGPGGSNPSGSNPGGSNPGSSNSSSSNSSNLGSGGSGTQGMWRAISPIDMKAGKKGIREVAKKQYNKLKANKGTIAKAALKKSAGIALGATGGMLGLGVGVATGDLSNVFKYGGIGAGAGYLGGKGLAGNAIKTGENAKTSYRDNFYEPEARAVLNNTDELWKNPDIRELYKGKSKQELQNDVNQFISLGITDPEKIAAAMKVKDSGGINLTNEDKARAAALETGISDSAFGTEKNRREYRDSIRDSLMRSLGCSKAVADKLADKQMEYITQIKENYHS